jgi:hypothetical protein
VLLLKTVRCDFLMARYLVSFIESGRLTRRIFLGDGLELVVGKNSVGQSKGLGTWAKGKLPVKKAPRRLTLQARLGSKLPYNHNYTQPHRAVLRETGLSHSYGFGWRTGAFPNGFPFSPVQESLRLRERLQGDTMST